MDNNNNNNNNFFFCMDSLSVSASDTFPKSFIIYMELYNWQFLDRLLKQRTT